MVHELLAVDERHGARAVHHGQRVQIGALMEHGGHCIVAGGGRGGGRLHHQQAAQDARACGLAQVRQHGHAAVLHHFLCRALHGLARGLGGAAQQPALSVRDVQVAQRAQVVACLDAFGNQLGAKHMGYALDGLQHLQVFGLVADVADEVFVDLHEVGLHLGPQPQAGAAIAKVVQRQPRAAGVHRLDGLAQLGHVGHALVLGDFQHQKAGAHAKAAHGLAQHRRAHQGHPVHQRVGADVHKQAARRLLNAPLLQGGEHAQQLEVLKDVLAPRQLQQGIGRVQRGALGAPDQGFVGIHAALAQVGQGLKHAVQAPFAHELCQRALAMARSRGQQGHHRLQSAPKGVVRHGRWGALSKVPTISAGCDNLVTHCFREVTGHSLGWTFGGHAGCSCVGSTLAQRQGCREGSV